jgi:hypothetical protein
MGNMPPPEDFVEKFCRPELISHETKAARPRAGSGEIVRSATAPHECGVPEHGHPGDVWRCDCGRRYTCVDYTTMRGNFVTMRADWLRRFWPWPR